MNLTNDDKGNFENDDPQWFEAEKSSLEPQIPLKLYKSIIKTLPSRFLSKHNAYLDNIAPWLQLSTSKSKSKSITEDDEEEGEEEKEEKETGEKERQVYVRLSINNKELLKQYCLGIETKLFEDRRIKPDTKDLFVRCKNLEGKDIEKEDFEALIEYAKKSSIFKGKYTIEIFETSILLH
jgi:hypothetical protein